MSRLLTLRPDLDARRARPTTELPADSGPTVIARLAEQRQRGTSAAADGRRFEGDWPDRTSAISEHDLFMGYRNVGRHRPREGGI